jgi:hypothetical protein
MGNRLTEVCARELENHLEGLFATTRKLSPTLRETPVIGGVFIADLDHSCLLTQVCAALCAREKFRQSAPDWAPDLPLRQKDCDELENSDSTRLNLVGLFGSSLRFAYWDQTHPPFDVYASGALADPAAPDDIRNDLSLQREFPPRPLAGLCDGELVWRSPEMLAQHRHMQALCAAADARSLLGS